MKVGWPPVIGVKHDVIVVTEDNKYGQEKRYIR